jgi:hypothetical protein
VPPAPVIGAKRRPRQVDTSMHFCPHPGCEVLYLYAADNSLGPRIRYTPLVFTTE